MFDGGNEEASIIVSFSVLPFRRVRERHSKHTLSFQNVLQVNDLPPLLPNPMPVKYYNYQYYQSGEYVVVSFLGSVGFSV